MMGIHGLELDPSVRNLIMETGIGNFILFKRNIKDQVQVKGLCDSLVKTCLEAGLPQPIIAVDQEGGPIQRLGPPNWPVVPSNSSVAWSDNPTDGVIRQAKLVAITLKDAGIGINLAPVLDLAQPGTKGVLAERSYG
ncbi:MAG: glycoside hydrolase family 3 N-terminal domain-containing protein, partial [Dissulfurimicrobium sp.]